jgi:hypothetical protein
MRSMVEGYSRITERHVNRAYPSTTLRVVPLPDSVRI